MNTIIFVCGAKTGTYAQMQMRRVLERARPDATVKIIGAYYYTYTDPEHLHKVLKDLNEELKKHTDILLIGHSMGGIIVGASSLENVSAVATINAPHNARRLQIPEMKRALNYDEGFARRVPVVSFSSPFDRKVMQAETTLAHATEVELWMNHGTMLFLIPYWIRKVVRITENVAKKYKQKQEFRKEKKTKYFEQEAKSTK